MSAAKEKELQQTFSWSRSGVYSDYNRVLGHYQAVACLEHARGETLLDMPCGDGTLTAMLSTRFKRVVGVDASRVHLAEARKRLPLVEFHEALLEEFDTKTRFDTVTMINVLEHVVDPAVALQRAARLLAPGGVLLVHVPNALAINRRIAVLMGTLAECEELSPFDIQVAGHRRSYSLVSLCADISKAGLRSVATGGVFYKMLSTPQMDWFLKNGLWEEGGFGWGRVGGEQKDWRSEFCRACYEIGRERPEDCNIIYACVER
ncbi:MAG TPA: class I SAM-dependent methyltransferase [Nitrospiraceae bacterium]|nr:class I SAM-dependent methyltransferase [Nitrospiraceae bacterium]